MGVRVRRSRKIVLISLAIAVLLVSATIAMLPRLLKLDQVRARIEERLTEVLGREVVISRARLSFMTGPKVVLEDISIADTEGFGPEPLIQATSLQLKAGLSQILDGIIGIKGISLIQPRLRLARNPDGIWNFQDSALPMSGVLLSTSGINQDFLDNLDGATNFILSTDEINIRQGEVTLIDRSGKILKRDLTVAGIDGRLFDLTPEASKRIIVSFKLFDKSSTVTLDGSLGPADGTEDLNRIPLSLTVRAPEVMMRAVPVPIKDISLVLSGTFLTEQSVSGTFTEGFHFRQDISFTDVEAKTEKGFSLVDNLSGTLSQEGRIQPGNRSIQLDSFDLTAGNARLSAAGLVRHDGVLPYLEMNFKSNSPDLAGLMKHFPDLERKLKIKGGISAEGSLKGVAGKDLTAFIDVNSASIEADRGSALLEDPSTSSTPPDADHGFVDLLPPSLPLTVSAKLSLPRGRFEWVTFSDLTADVRLKNRWVSMDRMKFNAFGGLIEGSAWFNMRKLPATYGNDIRIRDMEIDKFLTSFAGLKGLMYGTASLDLFVSGRGKNMDQFKENTTGLGRFQISSGRYTPANFLKEALNAASIRTDSLHSDETEFNSMDSSIAVRGGKVDFTSLDCLSEDWSLEGSGIIGMDQSLSLRYRMTLSDSKASTIGADNLRTLPKDKSGNFQIPFRLSGTLTSPTFLLDSQETAQTAEK